jgi:hypothetical protein
MGFLIEFSGGCGIASGRKYATFRLKNYETIG